MKTKILKSFLLFAAMIPFITSCAVPKVGEDYESKETFLCLKTDSEETRHKQVLRINEWPSCARPFYTVTYLDKTRGFYAEDFVQGVSTMLYVTFSVSEGTSSQYEFKAKEIPVCPTCGKPMKYLTIVCTYLIDY